MQIETATREQLVEEVIRLRQRNFALEALIKVIEIPKRMRQFLEDTAVALSSTTKAAEPYTGEHQRQVSILAPLIAEKMGLSETDQESCRIGGAIHDIGKIGAGVLSIVVLPRRLEDCEFDVIKLHPIVGHRILEAFACPWPLGEIALDHHEKFNGSGYPFGKDHTKLLTVTQVVTVADVVEAMSNARPYRKDTPGLERALDYISDQSGIEFCPDCVDACIGVFDSGFRFSTN